MPIPDPVSATEQNTLSPCSAIKWLRSITFVLNEDAAGTLIPDIDSTINWLEQYHEWFMRAIGIHHGMGQHFLYNRQVTFLGSSLLNNVYSLRQVASASLNLGYANSITLEIGHALANEQALESLLSDHHFHSISFIVSSECAESSQNDALRLLEKIADYPISLAVIGDAMDLMDMKLMRSSILNREDLAWHPMPSSDNFNSSCSANPVRTCHNRLQLYVDQFGSFYPCVGLMGLEAFRLGSISEPFEQTLLTDPKVMSEIQKWAEHGPNVEGTPQPKVAISEFGPMCDWHLAHITRPDS